ncbi:hypothetical protein [Aliarcobacter butzleri]|uniref:hypothetical protein n=1 Tax=Aliarcobacter butzleri TaxID=28197 RepID=UPI00263F3BF3|nr:hypothetical protein [Aliarcobacter butzleri]MDN5049654.1 hypothetical protein [Aliarcobacter butzleri]MDN5056543.1 hypothetical protein [Aliarcobacter butzleri]
MKFENKEFIPYKFPYEHNYRNYAQFVISNDIDFSKNDYYVYLISNPLKFNYQKTNNNYYVFVAILVQNKETKEFSIKLEKFDFKSILQLNIFGKINPLGDVSLFEDIDDKFNKLIYETKINISDTTQFEKLSLEQVVTRFDILKRAGIHKFNYFKDLEFYLYHVDGKKILIPAIEVLKYFYLFNYTYQDEPKSHFCQDILTPNGILNSLNINKYDAIKRHYDLEINGNYSENDIYKILFFITNKRRLQQYSNVENIYRKTNIISAVLPREDLRLIARVFDYKKIDLLLVLNIVTHNFDYIKDFPDNFTCEYRHPKSQFKEKDENKRNPSKDVKKKARKNTNLETNDDLYGNNELEYEEETLSTFKLNINCEKASEPINLNLTKIVDKQKKQQGGKKKKDYSDLKNTPLTSKEDKGNSDEAISKKEDNNEEENDSNKNYLNLVEIINHLKNNLDFKFIDEKTFKFPEVINSKGEKIKRSFMFIDVKNQIKRKYYMAKLQYKNVNDIYIIELQRRLNKEQKSFLVIKKNSETIDSLNRKFISKELIDLAKNGNRVWFSSNIELLENEYLTLMHRGDVKSFEEKLLKELR